MIFVYFKYLKYAFVHYRSVNVCVGIGVNTKFMYIQCKEPLLFNYMFNSTCLKPSINQNFIICI